MVQNPIYGITVQTGHVDMTNIHYALTESIKAPGMKMKLT